MGAVEHLKTVCCLGLSPESAMIAVTPLLHEIIPHGWPRFCLFDPDVTITSAYAENPEAGPLARERFAQFMDDPTSIASLMIPAFHGVGIGWTLHRQGRGYLESGYYRDVEAPLDSCWILDAMIADEGLPFAGMQLTRPRSARPFTADDVRRLDGLRPWLAHAFRPRSCADKTSHRRGLFSARGAAILSGQLILTCDMKRLFQTPALDTLLMMAGGDTSVFSKRPWAGRERLPPSIGRLVQRLVDAADGTLSEPPVLRLRNAFGLLTLEASWLVPADTLPEDAARNPKSCLIAVTIELHEHPIAYAARVLRECGATPAQTKVGIELALGKAKPVIAAELGVRPSSVADVTKKLYQALGVHNSAELGTKIWLGRKQDGEEHRAHLYPAD